jgi:hypothetical protein
LYISKKTGFDVSKKAELLRLTTNPEYMTIKAKTASQRGGHRAKHSAFRRRVVLLTEDSSAMESQADIEIIGSNISRVEDLPQSALTLISDLAATYHDQKKNWVKIAEEFNKVSAIKLTKLQIKNAFTNHFSRQSYKLSSKAPELVEERISPPSSSPMQPVAMMFTSSEITSAEAAAELALQPIYQPSSNSAFSLHEIDQVTLCQAAKGQKWSTDEEAIIHYFNKGGRHKILTDGDQKSLNYQKFVNQFTHHAKLQKLENPSANLFLRTAEMIREKVKTLKDKKAWC